MIDLSRREQYYWRSEQVYLCALKCDEKILLRPALTSQNFIPNLRKQQEKLLPKTGNRVNQVHLSQSILISIVKLWPREHMTIKTTLIDYTQTISTFFRVTSFSLFQQIP